MKMAHPHPNLAVDEGDLTMLHPDVGEARHTTLTQRPAPVARVEKGAAEAAKQLLPPPPRVLKAKA